MKQKRQSGITLIALIITIIVLIILAGVVIVTLSGNNSAPQKATEAAQKDAIAEAKDEIAMESQKDLLDYYDNKYVSKTSTGASGEATTRGVVENAAARAIENVHNRNSLLLSTSGVNTTEHKITLNTKSFTVTGTIEENGGVTWSDGILSGDTGEQPGENVYADLIGTDDSVYRGLATQSEVNPYLFAYEIISEPQTANEDGIMEGTKVADSNGGIKVADNNNSVGTCRISGINWNYLEKEYDIVTKGSYSKYIKHGMTDEEIPTCIKKLVIPSEVKLDENGNLSSSGKKYLVTEDIYGGSMSYEYVTDLIYPSTITSVVETNR